MTGNPVTPLCHTHTVANHWRNPMHDIIVSTVSIAFFVAFYKAWAFCVFGPKD